MAEDPGFKCSGDYLSMIIFSFCRMRLEQLMKGSNLLAMPIAWNRVRFWPCPEGISCPTVLSNEIYYLDDDTFR